METTKTKKATEEVKGEKTTQTLDSKELRKQERMACEKEIAAVLTKYGCELTAQMIVGETRIIPQIFIIDERG